MIYWCEVKMKKVGILVRVSTDEQAKVEEGSIKNQTSSCSKYVKGENIKCDGQWGEIVEKYVDDGYSGKDLNRPGVKKLIADVAKGRIDTIIMTEISRLSRNKRDWLDLLSFFEKHGVEFITLRQQFDLSTPMGRMILSLMIEFSQLEREQTIERVNASIRERVSRGLSNGGPITFGLKKTERKGHLEVDAAEQVIGNDMIDIFLDSANGLKDATLIINEKGYRKAGNKNWTPESLRHWIRSRAIIGEVELNAKNKSKDQAKLSENKRYQIFNAVWEPVINKDKWLAANNKLDENYRRLKVSSWNNHDYLLSGILKCSNRKTLIGMSGTGRSGKKYVHYTHRTKDKKSCNCGIKNIPADKADKAVLKQLKKLIKAPDLVRQLSEKANQEFQIKRPNYNQMVVANQNKIKGIELNSTR